MAIGGDITIYPKSCTFNAVTYSNTSGGPMRFVYRDGGTPLKTRTGADRYSQAVNIVDHDCEGTLTLAKFANDLAKGTKSSLVFVVEDSDGADVTLTFANMIVYDVRGTQDRAQSASCDIVFVYESADGSTDPLTVT